MCDVARGLEHIHSHGFIHCDLTPKNVFLTKDLRAKIGDLGAAKLSEGKDLTDCAPGTPGYMGPEAKRPECRYNEKLDIYSFGCVVLYTFTGTEEDIDDIEKWLKCISQSVDLQELARQCLQHDSQNRPNTGEVYKRLCHIKKKSTTPNADVKPQQNSTIVKEVQIKAIKIGSTCSSVTEIFNLLMSHSFFLDDIIIVKHVNKPYAKSCLNNIVSMQLSGNITDGDLVKSKYINLLIDTSCTALPEIMVMIKNADKQFSIKQSQIAFPEESIAVNHSGICGFNEPFSKNIVTAKPCTTEICYDETDMAVAMLSLCVYRFFWLFYSPEPLLYLASFDDTSGKQRCVTRRCKDYLLPLEHNVCIESGISIDEVVASPCQDHLSSAEHNARVESNTFRDEIDVSSCQECPLPVKHNACIESDISREDEVFASSNFVMHESRSDSKSPFDNIMSLLKRPCLLFLVGCFILFLGFIFFLF